MKCRGCGEDTRDLMIEGIGWMHVGCELERLNALLVEAMCEAKYYKDRLDEARQEED